MIMTNHPIGNKLEDFKVLNKIGSGGFANVYKAKCKQPGYEDQYVAIKMINRIYVKKKKLEKLVKSEISIHSILCHPAIVKFYTWFSDEKYVYLVLELCERGSLDKYLRSNERLSEKNACYVIKQIIDAVRYLHTRFILHRDLSLKNILFTDDMQIKIADFGMATKLTHANEKKNTMVGTANYMSPEVVQKGGYDAKADCWSVGCVLYALLYGTPPFDGKEKNYMEIMNNAVMSQLQFPSDASPEARELLEGMLIKDPKCRISISESLNYPFFRKYENTFDRKLKLNPLRSRDSGLSSLSCSQPLYKNCDASDGVPNSYGSNIKEMNRYGHIVPSNLEKVHVNRMPYCHSGSSSNLSGHQKEQESNMRGRQRAETSRKTKYNAPSCINQLKNKILALPPRHEHNECVLSRLVCSDSQECYPAEGGLRCKNGNLYKIGSPMHPNFTNLHQQLYSNDGQESQLEDVHIRSHSESPLPYPLHRLQNIRSEELYSQSCYSDHNTMVNNIHSGNGYVHKEVSYKNSQEDISKTSCSHDHYCSPDVRCSHEMVCCCHQYLDNPPTTNQSDHYQPQRSREYKNSPCLNIILEKNLSTGRIGLKGVVEPLTTERLVPKRNSVKNAVFSILDDGQVCLEFLRVKRNRKFVTHVCFISRDGQNILLYKPKKNIVPLNQPPPLPKNHHDVKYFTFDDLPENHWKKYQYAKKFIEMVKAKTPKVTLYGENAQCVMMENSPDPNYEVYFYDGCLITQIGSQTTFTDQNGSSQKLACESDLSADVQFKWSVYTMMKERCQRAEAYWEKSPESIFPIILGRKPSALLSTLDANKENTSSLRSSALNGVVNAMKSCDVTLSTNCSPSLNSLQRCIPSPLHNQRNMMKSCDVTVSTNDSPLQNSLLRGTPSSLQSQRNVVLSIKSIAEIVLDLKEMPRVENEKVVAEYKDGIQMWISRNGQEVCFYDTKTGNWLTNIQQDLKNMKRFQYDLAGILGYVMSEEARTK